MIVAGTDDGDDNSERSSVGKQEGQIVGRKLSAKTIKAILELICDEAVSFPSSLNSNRELECSSVFPWRKLMSMFNLFFKTSFVLFRDFLSNPN